MSSSLRRSFKWVFALAIIFSLFKINAMFGVYSYGTWTKDCDNDSYVRLLTWNVHRSSPDFKSKQVDIANEIIRQHADIVLLNEINLTEAPILDSLIRTIYPFSDNTWGRWCGDILYSKFPIQCSVQLKPLNYYSLIYEFRLNYNDQNIRIVGCHLASANNFLNDSQYALEEKGNPSLLSYISAYLKGQSQRTEETELIRNCILSEDLPTIVMGDMNDFSGTPPLNTLQNAGLKDAWWERGSGFGVTFRERWMHFRLDHILYDSHWNPISISVVQSDLSDHSPLVGEFTLIK